ncbi:MAG: Flp family type IVb pilin [Acidimicrobiia bacterium]
MFRVCAACQSRFVKDEEGATMMEYALLIALIAMVVIAGAIFFGTELSEKFSEVGATLEGI